ncbi:uncharacterized protein LOC109808711 [Cajanus cajan]|uniref:uncharacterized protein LOC109808711 n=1 Tax=Cajanus cajan TaxID=3821 RepID=UPI00098DC74E|nr:uncharacterized protein LOC109808711 [Cajanus cajan]
MAPSVWCSNRRVDLLLQFEDLGGVMEGLQQINMNTSHFSSMMDERSAISKNKRSRRVTYYACGGRVRLHALRKFGHKFFRCPNYRKAWNCGYFQCMDEKTFEHMEQLIEEQQDLIVNMKKCVGVYKLLLCCSLGLFLFVVLVALYIDLFYAKFVKYKLVLERQVMKK